MLGMIGIAFAAGLAVAFVLPRHASCGQQLGLGAAVGALGLPLVIGLATAIVGAWPTPGDGAVALLAMLLYGALLGATGGSVVWVIGRIPFVSQALFGRPGLDPEGESMALEALEARRRQALRRAAAQVVGEIAVGDYDDDLWAQAEDEVGPVPERRERRYIQLRAERIVHG